MTLLRRHSKLADGLKLVAHRFDGYWKDVGTVHSLWEANMELLDEDSGSSLDDDSWRIYSKTPVKPPHYIAPEARLRNCYVTEGCEISGEIDHSVIFEGVTVEEGAKIEDSIIMPGAKIGKGALVHKAIIGPNASVGEKAVIGSKDDGADKSWVNEKICTNDITLLGQDVTVSAGKKIAVNSMVIEIAV